MRRMRTNEREMFPLAYRESIINTTYSCTVIHYFDPSGEVNGEWRSVRISVVEDEGRQIDPAKVSMSLRWTGQEMC